MVIWEFARFISRGFHYSVKFKIMYKAITIDQIFRKFEEDMQKRDVNGALKLLANNMQHGIIKLKMKLSQN